LHVTDIETSYIVQLLLISHYPKAREVESDSNSQVRGWIKSMDRDEVEDAGISVDGLLDSNIIDTAEKLLKEAGNMVGWFLWFEGNVC
jgi:hypothetical protein